MSTTIRLKNSSALVSGKAKEPTPSDLAQGELAVNINKDDPSLFVKDSDGVVRKIAGSDAVGVEGQYLSIAADAEAQTVATTETTTFKGLVDADKGISVTGGDSSADFYYQLSDDSIRVTKALNLRKHLNVSNSSDPDSRRSLGTFSTLKASLVTNNSSPTAGHVGIQSLFSVASGETAVHVSHFCAASSDNIQNLNVENYYGFVTGGIRQGSKNYNFYSSGGITAGSTENYGFYSAGLTTISAGINYNFYADGNAPNFFAGDTHIGGSTARNTFDLWKSTLTEEQLEQYQAGTYAVPANVSVPGDGSFARQWWYDQQSAEDQALIDSGELEYPTHLAAATFTDTFDLGDNTKIKLGSDGTADFTGVTTHAGGVSVTGATVPSDASDSRYPLLNGYSGGRLEILPRGRENSEQVKLSLHTPDSAGAGGAAELIHNKSLGGAAENVLRVTGDWSGDYSGTGGNAYLTNAYLLVAGDIANTTTSFSKPIIGVSSGTDVDTDNNWVSFLATTTLAANANKAASYIGYLSRVGSDSGDTAFGFYGDGDAPNFFKGNTYIGGAATRNTRELWESTLTEEQKEQLSAGTLAIPANVSTPGDGSFVRQWWYNQQSAENQALIDSGELDYPKNFQAANFTDNFALGENTKINLLSDGVGEFSGGVRVTGSGTIDNGMTANNGVLRFTQNSQQAIIIRDTRINASGRVFNFAANSDATEIDGKQVINGTQCTLTKPPTKDADDNDLYLASGNSACQFQAGFDDVKFAGSFGFVKAAVTTASNTSVDHFWGYNADNSLGLFNAEDPDSTQKVTGYYTDLQQRTNKNIYAFYSARNAPSYFNGAVTGGGTDAASAVWSIDSTGTATGIDVTAASVVTDADNGTVETLLDIITDLRSRIKDLEEG